MKLDNMLSFDEILEAAPFLDPTLLVTNIIPNVTEFELIVLYQNSVFAYLTEDSEQILSHHLMTRTLEFIKWADSHGYLNWFRPTMHARAAEHDRTDVMAYAAAQQYPN